MITLSNFWCWVRGRPPKWTHLNLSEAFGFAASMEPAGGAPPPESTPPDPTPSPTNQVPTQGAQ